MARFPWIERTAACAVVLVVGASAGCGGGGRAEAPASEFASGEEAPREEKPVDDGLKVEGIRGSLPAEAVSTALEARTAGFQKCFTKRYRALEVLGGSIEFQFIAALDGTVKDVFVAATDVGDRDTERCLLAVASRARFPEPQGGEAEFRWSLSVDVLGGVRPPVPFTAEFIRDAVREQQGTLEACGSPVGMTVTAYLSPGGAVRAAGASRTAEIPEETVDCVLDAFRQWTLPDPGSYVGKVSFTFEES